MSYLSSDDRNTLVALQRWMTSPRLLETDNLVVADCRNVSDVHPRVRENSRLANIRIPYPDEAERLEYLTESLSGIFDESGNGSRSIGGDDFGLEFCSFAFVAARRAAFSMTA